MILTKLFDSFESWTSIDFPKLNQLLK